MSADLKKVGATVYAMSNEGAGDLQKMQQSAKLDSTYVFLSDKESKAASQYAGRDLESGVLRVAVFVIGKDGKILYGNDDESIEPEAWAKPVLTAIQSAG